MRHLANLCGENFAIFETFAVINPAKEHNSMINLKDIIMMQVGKSSFSKK